MKGGIHKCCLCGSGKYFLVGAYDRAAPRENDFGIPGFSRSIFRCSSCDVFFNDRDYPFDYKSDYNQATYCNKLRQVYDRIMALPPEASDNVQRVKRIIEFTRRAGFDRHMKILDVGSGLSVFAGRLIACGYENCAVIDPSPLSVNHARDYAGVKTAVTGELKDWNENDKVDLICFNKVLEHIKDPVQVLGLAGKMLTAEGIAYIELPDGENAVKNGSAWEREEFFAGHYTAFSQKSLEYLVDHAGFEILQSQAIHEPSDKYTIYAFLQLKR